MVYDFTIYLRDKQTNKAISLRQIASDESAEDCVIKLYRYLNNRYPDYKIICVQYRGIADFTLEV